MNDITTSVSQMTSGDLADQLQNLQLTDAQATIALVISIIVGLVICFFGFKLVRVLSAIAGFLIGLTVGIPLAIALNLEGIAFLGVMIACAVVLAILAALLYRVGIFIWVFFLVAGVAASVILPGSTVVAIVCLAIALILAILSAVFAEPFIIVISSLCGGLSAGNSIAMLIGFDGNMLVKYGIILVLIILGIVIQFMTRSKEVSKKERVYADEYKAKSSREAEVEQARKLLDDDGDEEESSDDDDDIRFID